MAIGKIRVETKFSKDDPGIAFKKVLTSNQPSRDLGAIPIPTWNRCFRIPCQLL